MTERQRRQHWRTIQAQRDRIAVRMIPSWKRALMAQIQPVLSEISEATVRDMEQRIPSLIQGDQVEEALWKNIETAGVYFAKKTFKAAEKAAPAGRILKAEIPTDEQWKNFVRYKLERLAGNRITAITDSSRDLAIRIVKDTLAEGAKEGMGTSQLSVLLRDNMKEKWGDFSTYRAARIARTETTMASNLGSLTGAQQTGEPMLKVWLSTRDSRTRGPRRPNRSRYDHYDKYPAGPDGEKRELNEPFTKTGEELMHPGAYSGSAGNVIHCRCTMIYEPKIQDEQGVIPPPERTPPKPPVIPKPPKPPTPPPPATPSRAQLVKEAKEKLSKLENKTAKAQFKVEDLTDAYNNKSGEVHSLSMKIGEARRAGDEVLVGKLEPELNLLLRELDEIEKQYNKAFNEYKKILKVGYADEVTKILSLDNGTNIELEELRNVRASTNKGYITAAGARRAGEAAETYSRVMGNVDPKYGNTSHKVFSSGANKTAFATNNTAFVFKNSDTATLCHELGHCFEEGSEFMRKKVRDFLEMRCSGEKLKRIYKGDRGFGVELGWEDKFINHYTGKLYNRASEGALFSRELVDNAYGSEVFSMWWTHVMRDPAYFVQTDPEFFEFFYNAILEMQGVI